ncbi:MAG: hypothetical protein WAW92_04795 [Minisyncoccia bacterium]
MKDFTKEMVINEFIGVIDMNNTLGLGSHNKELWYMTQTLGIREEVSKEVNRLADIRYKERGDRIDSVKR